MRDGLLKSRALITLVDWVAVLAEIALLFAWKAAAMQGAGRVLVAWLVISGLGGCACILAPTGRLPPPAFGHLLLVVCSVLSGGALFWFGHSLLGALALMGLFGTCVYRHRCDAAERVPRLR
ncbi:hypothetical protein CKY39_12255 [Variovorax boronicumulans]|uniref:DUF2568 domain-containing protein n=1 Tax=Variovorax boronicumulans TaxID=436515 RepID=A0A250DI10_9BURK|nr:hypothetical protein [Variovorax boronicumulans]ATA53904.1 hypothetical protein CKY39_12255 [Variovorax boronicumulans]